MWQDYADEYLGYLVNFILGWGDSSRVPNRLPTYEGWLVQTERRRPWGGELTARSGTDQSN